MMTFKKLTNEERQELEVMLTLGGAKVEWLNQTICMIDGEISFNPDTCAWKYDSVAKGHALPDESIEAIAGLFLDLLGKGGNKAPTMIHFDDLEAA